jgi:HEAT repeat protein
MGIRCFWTILIAACGLAARADGPPSDRGAASPPKAGPAILQEPPIAQRIAELGHRELAVRWYAVYALGQRAAVAQEAVEPLRKRLDAVDEHEYVRAAAAWALGRIGAPAAAAVLSLVATLESQLPAVRQHAALALGHIGPAARASTPALERLLTDASPAVRAAAAASLWRLMRNDRAVAVLCEMTTSSDDDASYIAVVTLGELGAAGDRVPAALGAALAHCDADIRRAAAASLGALGPAATGPLVLALSAKSAECRAAAVEPLSGLGPEHVPRVAAMLDDPTPQVRSAAARALGRHGPQARSALDRLLKAAEDPDATVRTAAADAIRKVRGK